MADVVYNMLGKKGAAKYYFITFFSILTTAWLYVYNRVIMVMMALLFAMFIIENFYMSVNMLLYHNHFKDDVQRFISYTTHVKIFITVLTILLYIQARWL